MLVTPTPLFPKLALLAASALGFAVALLAVPEFTPRHPAPPLDRPARFQTEPQLLAIYILDPGGIPGAIIDLGSGPQAYTQGQNPNGETLLYAADNGAVLLIDDQLLLVQSVPKGSRDTLEKDQANSPSGHRCVF
ncbi:MAG: hypothetical protein ACI9VR_001147 [Cognaticolwellia sp.]|jgi:hypothetical protein